MTHNQKEQFELSAQDKIRVAVSVCGTEAVWDKLEEFCKERGLLTLADDLVILHDGSIANEDTCNWVSNQELEEFLEWCEKENA